LGYPEPTGAIGLSLRLLRDLGVFAVPTFLFIAGAFVAYAARGDPPSLSRRFVWRSLNHIAWPYLIWSVAFYALTYVRYGQSSSALGYLKNLLTGYPYHFAILLLLFYLLSPLLAPAGARHPWLLLGAIAVFQLFLIGLHLPGALGFTFPKAAGILAPPVVRGTLAEWAIYFPLGLVYSLHARRALPWLQRWRWALLAAVLLLFVFGELTASRLINFQLARFLIAVPFVLLLPLVSRNRIPSVRQLEAIGKDSFGIYLTHLLVLDLVFLVVETVAPGAFGFVPLLVPLLVIAGVAAPMAVMTAVSRSPARGAYRYLFG
jgi:membrane-bound acyltransferase YfiQ involved in biofilm formation